VELFFGVVYTVNFSGCVHGHNFLAVHTVVFLAVYTVEKFWPCIRWKYFGRVYGGKILAVYTAKTTSRMVPTYTKTRRTRVQCRGCPCGIRRQACHGLFRAGRNSRRAMQHGATHFLCKNHGCEGSSTLLRWGNCSRIGDRKHWCARWNPPRGGLTRLHACARVRQYASSLLVATSLVHQLWTTS